MKKEFYLDFSKPDVDGDYFSSEAARSVAEQIVNLEVFEIVGAFEKPIGNIVDTEFLNDGTIRATGEIDEEVEVSKNAALTIDYFIRDFDLYDRFREVKSLMVKKVFLVKDKSEILKYKK